MPTCRIFNCDRPAVAFGRCQTHHEVWLKNHAPKAKPEPTTRRCAWCTDPIPPSRGRPKTYCSQSCRQRAFEERRRTGKTLDLRGPLDNDPPPPPIRFAPRCIEPDCNRPTYLRHLCAEHYRASLTVETTPGFGPTRHQPPALASAAA